MCNSREYIQIQTSANSFINRVIGINSDSFRFAHLNHAHHNHSPLPRPRCQTANRPRGNVLISHISSLVQFLLTKRLRRRKNEVEIVEHSHRSACVWPREIIRLCGSNVLHLLHHVVSSPLILTASHRRLICFDRVCA